MNDGTLSLGRTSTSAPVNFFSSDNAPSPSFKHPISLDAISNLVVTKLSLSGTKSTIRV